MSLKPAVSTQRPRIPVNAWGLLLRAVIAVVILLSANMVRVPITAWIAPTQPQQPEDSPEGLLIKSLLFFITPILIFGFLAVWMPLVERRELREIGFPNWKGILPGLAGGLLVVAVPIAIGWPIAQLFGHPLETLDVEVTPPAEISVALAVAYIFYFLVRSFVLQGIPEEFLYRGWLFSTTKSKPLFTVVWTTLAFAIIHLASSGGQQSTMDFIYYLMMPLGMGAIAGAVVLWTDNTWWAAGTHGGFHTLVAVFTVIFPIALDSSTWVILGTAQLVAAIIIICVWSTRTSRKSIA